MKRNVGNVERIIRVIVGLALLSLVFILEGNMRWWGLIGLLPIATGAIGYCPPYAMMGIDTCRKDDAAAAPR